MGVIAYVTDVLLQYSCVNSLEMLERRTPNSSRLMYVELYFSSCTIFMTQTFHISFTDYGFSLGTVISFLQKQNGALWFMVHITAMWSVCLHK